MITDPTGHKVSDQSHFDPPESDDGEDVERQLDAYGHLTWTIGDDDWMACFDAVHVRGEIHYHVVVNCESGGFIDTLETGALPVAVAAAKLLDLPLAYVDTGIEGHLETTQRNRSLPYDQRTPLGRFAYRGCVKRWNRHIRQLVKAPK